jgi:hypothetical protein
MRGAGVVRFSSIFPLIFPTSYFHPGKIDNFYMTQAKVIEEKLSMY